MKPSDITPELVHQQVVRARRHMTLGNTPAEATIVHLAERVAALEAVREAAEEFERYYQQSLGSASAHDYRLRDAAQLNLHATLAAVAAANPEVTDG